MQRNRGFTLIELTVSLAVAGVLAGIAVPPLSSFADRQRATSMVVSVMANIALARSAAITHRQRTILCPSHDARTCTTGSDWSNGWILFLDGDGNSMPDRAQEILQSGGFMAGGKFRLLTTSGRQHLRYLPDGRSAGSNLTLSVCNEDDQLLASVIVSNAGRPRSERPRTATICPG